MAYSFQSFSVGQILTAGQMNQVEVNVRDHQHGNAGVTSTMGSINVTNAAQSSSANRFRHLNTMARAYRDSVQAIANATDTVLNFPAENIDTDGLHDNATNNGRITVALAGKYQIGGSVMWASGGTDTRFLHVRTNGVDRRASDHDAGAQFLSAETMWNMAVNDYIEVVVQQNSGGSLDAAADIRTAIWAYYIGE